MLRLCALTALALSTTAHALDIPYGDFVGDTVEFLNVTESSGELVALYGAPTPVADALDFPATGFTVEAENGAVEFLEGEVTVTIEADAGRLIQAIEVSEIGTYGIVGAAGQVSVTAVLLVESGADLYSESITFARNELGSGPWTASLAAIIPPTAEVTVTFVNQLFASGGTPGVASINKTSVSIACITCPEGECAPLGACCFDSGSCMISSEPDCTAAGGTYQGDDVTCAGGMCVQDGACCFFSGSCTFGSEGDCIASGGTYQGDGVTCADANCPQPGACCFDDGSCTFTSASDCAAAGGIYQGAQVPCNPCPQPGACCFDDGSCTFTFASDCAAAGGNYQGAQVPCNPCPQPGACCFDDGSCTFELEIDCMGAGGIYQGDGITCAGAGCPQPGACCFDDGSCTFVFASDCAAGGGIYQGAQVPCNPCPQPGACCFDDGSCTFGFESDCIAGGGIYQGDGVTCADADCPQPGACCFDDGSCTFGFESDCIAGGGIYQGDGVTCADADCPQPGACCFDDGSCTFGFESDCDAAGGIYKGDNVTCADADCPQPGACCFDDGSCTYVFEGECNAAGGDYQGDNVTCDDADCPQPGACCFDDGSCTFIFENDCDDVGATWQGDNVACEDVDCPVFLESVDVAIRDAATGDRVFVRGFRDGTVEHKFFTAAGGYTPWTVVPDPGAGLGFGRRLEAVEAIALDPNALIYIRAFDDGAFEQNIYTVGAGWTGWFDVPHPASDEPKEACDTFDAEGNPGLVESVDIEPFNGLPGARMFVRAWSSGLVEQCIYTPQDGYSGWSEIPPMGDLIDIVEGLGAETIESVQVTAEGGVFGRRLFVIGLRESRRVYQNIYTPAEGYTGWTRVRNGATAALGDNPLASVDVQSLGDGVVLYLRGRENGRVSQNLYTPADGFSGFERLTATSNPDGKTMESCCVEYLDPGYFGARIYLRCFQDGTVEQSYYSPATGQSRWEELPGDHN